MWETLLNSTCSKYCWSTSHRLHHSDFTTKQHYSILMNRECPSLWSFCSIEITCYQNYMPQVSGLSSWEDRWCCNAAPKHSSQMLVSKVPAHPPALVSMQLADPQGLPTVPGLFLQLGSSLLSFHILQPPVFPIWTHNVKKQIQDQSPNWWFCLTSFY